MPIFMDRHNVSEAVTAEHVAQLHQEDLKVQDQFGCRGLTYWFDEKRKTAFCLIEAPNMQALEDMHNMAHGEIPHSIIEVDPGIVESFLGRIEDPEKALNTTLNIINDPAFRTIMVIDLNKVPILKTESSLIAPHLTKFNNTIPDILKSYKGQQVKQTEHHYLIAFNSVSNAVHAAIDIYAMFMHISKELSVEKNILKISLSAGLPVTDKKSIFEDCIKSAERMCQMINGKIIITAEVKELYNNENAKAINEDDIITTLNHSDEKFLDLLMNYTEINWANVNLKAEDFCKPTGCSKSQLYRKMTLLYGKAPNSFLKEYRLSKALRLLNKNSGNISEIAFETGFSSPSYFSKCFQKRYGSIPSDYLHTKARQ